MANVISHLFRSSKADGTDLTQVQPSHWNDGHKFTGGNHGDVLARDTTDPNYGAIWTPPHVGAWNMITTTETGTQNNFNPYPGINGNTIIRCANTAPLTIAGLGGPAMAARFNGQTVRVVGHSAQVDCLHYASSSDPSFRLWNGIDAMRSLAPGGIGFVDYQWNQFDGLWMARSHNQGQWIRPGYSAAWYTAGGGGTWTVTQGNQVDYAYCVRDNTLFFCGYLNATTVSGNPASLNVSLPPGYRISRQFVSTLACAPTGVHEMCFAVFNATATTIPIQRLAGGTFVPASGTCYVYWNFVIPID